MERDKNLFNHSVKGSPNTKPGSTQDFQSQHDFTIGTFSAEVYGIRWKGYLFASDSAINPQKGALHTPRFLWV